MVKTAIGAIIGLSLGDGFGVFLLGQGFTVPYAVATFWACGVIGAAIGWTFRSQRKLKQESKRSVDAN